MVSKQKLFSHTVMAFNCMSVQEPRYLSDQITTRIAVTRRMTWSFQLFNIPFYKSNAKQRTVYNHMMHIWNNLDNTLKTFKFYLKM